MKRLSTAPIISALLMAGATLSIEARSPGIVVGIVVDQLRTDYLEQLRPYFCNKGFNRLFSDGVYLQDVDFHNTVANAPAGAAVVYTGAWPSANGITSRHSKDLLPDQLRLSTIADELFISNGNLTKIYSVSGDPQVSVVTAGHAGSSAIAPDAYTGKWSSPSYYGSMPPAVANKNHTSPISARMASASWRPINVPGLTAQSPGQNNDFSYAFSGAGRDAYTKYIQSAPFNAEITDIAIDLLKTLQNGRQDKPGMLNIEYSLAPYSYDYDGDNRPELIDSYIRLDAELGRLFDAIDKDYGSHNAVIFLTSSGYANEPEIQDAAARIPGSEISFKKAESLLNAYLSATHGNGDYVERISDGLLYLASKEIERKGLDISKVRNESRLFLLKMEGISDILTIDDAVGGGSSRSEEASLKIDYKNPPDLIISFSPGWTVTDDNVYPPVTYKVRHSAPLTPAFILAPDLKEDTVTTTVDATVLAPTISSILRIRSPNGSTSKPLNLKKKNL